MIVAFAAALGWWNLWLTQQLVDSTPWFMQVGLIPNYLVLAVMAAGFLYAMAIEQSRLVSTKSVTPWPMTDRVLVFGFAAFFVTFAFAGASAVLISHGLLAVHGARSADTNLVYQAFGALLWKVGDIVPLLKLTETLHWDPALTFPSFAGGTMLLLYKVALIVPTAQVLALASGLWTSASVAKGASTNEEVDGVTNTNAASRLRD